MIKPIIVDKDFLHTPCIEVFKLKGLNELIYDMFDTMRENGGIGLAANQIGVQLRVIVVNVNGYMKAFINPEIIKHSKKSITSIEGCLSVDSGLPQFKVSRHKWVVIEAMDQFGEIFKVKAHGLLANCLQHELDHLDGKLISDKGNKS